MFLDYTQLPFESYLSPLMLKGFFNLEQQDDGQYDQPCKVRIGIIGAGVSGIAAAAHITELGHDCHIFEAGDESSLGGIWTKTNKSSGLQISSHFYKPHHSVRWSNEYPGQEEIVQQIRDLWLRFGLDERTSFHCPVQSLNRVGSRWTINDGQAGLFDGIIAAVGTCGQARACALPGQEHYEGEVVHSTRLSDVDVAGRTVAVMGGGASAVEALEYAHDNGAAKVKVISRSEKWIIPRHRLLNTFLAACLSGPFTIWSYIVGELLRWLFYGQDCGHIAPSRSSKQHVYSSTPIVNSRALDIMRSGKADWVKGRCQHFEDDGIVVERHGDDLRSSRATLEKCDVCIQATGFQRPTLHFLEPYKGAYQAPNWWMQVFPPGEPTICALNSTWQEAFGSVGGGQIGLLTRLLLVFLMDTATQPTRASMERWVDFMIKWNGGLTFITHIEFYLWLVFAIAGNWRLWPWGSFIVLGGDVRKVKRRKESM